MINLLNFVYRFIRFIKYKLYKYYSNKFTYFLLRINKVTIGNHLVSNGIPKLFIHHSAKIKIGNGFRINNTVLSNPIGRNARCLLSVREDSVLNIGDNVGMSGTTIFCQKEIEIGNNVKIGGNVCIYDTDFHSLNSEDRKDTNKDKLGAKVKKVSISDHVFIGAHTTILKGVLIGENSIIGACSVLTKSVPANQIWAGNPAKFIKEIINET